jgi:hypothetical protein
MATIIGYDEAQKKRITCSSSSYRTGCGAIIAYTKPDVRSYSGTDISGGADGREWVVCPGCGQEVTIRAW